MIELQEMSLSKKIEEYAKFEHFCACHDSTAGYLAECMRKLCSVPECWQGTIWTMLRTCRRNLKKKKKIVIQCLVKLVFFFASLSRLSDILVSFMVKPIKPKYSFQDWFKFDLSKIRTNFSHILNWGCVYYEYSCFECRPLWLPCLLKTWLTSCCKDG